MSSTDSDELGKVVDMPLERVVGMARNEWTASIGIDGRHDPDYALGTGPLEPTTVGLAVYDGSCPGTEDECQAPETTSNAD